MNSHNSCFRIFSVLTNFFHCLANFVLCKHSLHKNLCTCPLPTAKKPPWLSRAILFSPTGQNENTHNWEAEGGEWGYHYHECKCLIWQLQNFLCLLQKPINQWGQSCCTRHSQRPCHIVTCPHQYHHLEREHRMDENDIVKAHSFFGIEHAEIALNT